MYDSEKKEKEQKRVEEIDGRMAIGGSGPAADLAKLAGRGCCRLLFVVVYYIRR